MTNIIERSIFIAAPVDRVWDAISDYREFGAWFRVAIDGPFVVGQTSSGQMTIPNFEHVRWNAAIEAIEPPHRLAFRWHPYAVEAGRDYSNEPRTLVEFTLTETAGGTELKVVESGFDALPASRRDEAFRMNDGGWAAQMENIRRHVER